MPVLHSHVTWLPCVWLQNDLARPIISLLQKSYHERQAALRPNVIQAMFCFFCLFLFLSVSSSGIFYPLCALLLRSCSQVHLAPFAQGR